MPLDRHIIEFGKQVEVLAGLDVGNMWDRVLGEFLNEFGRLQRAGLSEAEVGRELASFMDGLSEKPLGDLARQSSGVSYNQGRSAEILTAGESGDVEFVVRSEVLDSATCDSCARLDGAIVEVGTDEYFALMPPNRCLGGDRCRGFYVPIAAEGS